MKSAVKMAWLKKKSPINDVCSQEICLPEVIALRVFRTRLKRSSIGTFWELKCFNNEDVNAPLPLVPSEATCPGEVA